MTRAFLFLALFACDGAADTAGGPDADADADTDADSDTDSGGGVSPDAPVVTITNVQCSLNNDSNPFWVVDGTVTDPQGEDNISVMDNYAVIVQGGQEGERRPAVIMGGVLTCSWTGSPSEEPCEATGTVRAVAVDDEGHASAPAEWKLE